MPAWIEAATASAIHAQRRTELDARGMLWAHRLRPRPAPVEATPLRSLTGAALSTAIVHLVDDEDVTWSSIADAPGLHRSYLSTKITTSGPRAPGPNEAQPPDAELRPSAGGPKAGAPRAGANRHR